MVEEKKVPVGVKVISILYHIGALLFILQAGGVFFNGLFLPYAGGPDYITPTIIYFGFALLLFFIGKDLWKGKKWARVAAIFLSIVGLINLPLEYFLRTGSLVGSILADLSYSYIYATLGGLILFLIRLINEERLFNYFFYSLGSIIYILIAGYLLFSRKAKEFFAK